MPMRPVNRLKWLARRAQIPPTIARALFAACISAERSLADTGEIRPAVYFLAADGTSNTRHFQFATACGPDAVRSYVAEHMMAGDTMIAVLCSFLAGDRYLVIHLESVNLPPLAFGAPAPGRVLGEFEVGRDADSLIDRKSRLD